MTWFYMLFELILDVVMVFLSECEKMGKGKEKEGKDSQRHEMTYLVKQTGILQSGEAL